MFFVLYLDILILFNVSPFQSEHTSLRIKIHCLYANGESGSNSAATRRSSRRFILHFSYCRWSYIIIFTYQIICVPHVFWFFRHQNHWPVNYKYSNRIINFIVEILYYQILCDIYINDYSPWHALIQTLLNQFHFDCCWWNHFLFHNFNHTHTISVT